MVNKQIEDAAIGQKIVMIKLLNPGVAPAYQFEFENGGAIAVTKNGIIVTKKPAPGDPPPAAPTIELQPPRRRGRPKKL